MKNIMISSALVLLMIGCSPSDQNKTETVLDKTADKISNVADTAVKGLKNFADTARVKLDKFADSAAVRLKQADADAKAGLLKAKDNIIDRGAEKLKNKH